ncbi:hypothetical protein ACWELO_25260 [Streptomyces sp. NPDC004596]
MGLVLEFQAVLVEVRAEQMGQRRKSLSSFPIDRGAHRRAGSRRRGEEALQVVQHDAQAVLHADARGRRDMREKIDIVRDHFVDESEC